VEGIRACWACLCRPLEAATIETFLFGYLNACCLAFASVLLLKLRESKQQTGDQTANCATEVNLLRDDHHAYSSLTPIRQKIDPFALPPRKPIELPHHNGLDLTGYDGALQIFKSGSVQCCTAFDVLKLSHI
jgi:hypothetical protein